MSDVFRWLEGVRARPELFLRGHSLDQLRSMVCGYYAALDGHRIVKPVPDVRLHFNDWLYHFTGWSCSCGWAAAVGARHAEPAAGETKADGLLKFATGVCHRGIPTPPSTDVPPDPIARPTIGCTRGVRRPLEKGR
jgi:hypothetical protein